MLLVTAAALAGLPAPEFRGKVIGITDGDTIEGLIDHVSVKVRLHGIDAPEKGQPFGDRAKQKTAELVFGKAVRVIQRSTDRYGRVVGDIVLPDGRRLNRELVRSGFAWWYRQYAKKDRELERLEEEARDARIGLWRDNDPIPPWLWRKAGRR